MGKFETIDPVEAAYVANGFKNYFVEVEIGR